MQIFISLNVILKSIDLFEISINESINHIKIFFLIQSQYDNNEFFFY